MQRDFIRALEVIKRVLGQHDLTLDGVVDRISQEADVPTAEILSHSRRESVVYLRLGAYYVLREKFGVSFPQIAARLGRDNHTTIIHGVRRIQYGLERYGDEL